MEFVDYYEEIGFSKIQIDKIYEINRYATLLCPEQIIDVFVNDYLQQDKTKAFDSAWFFAKGYVLEAKRFLEKEVDLDITPINKKVMYIGIKAKDYNFKKASDNSQIEVDVIVLGDTICSYKATSSNCDYLMDIISKYYKTNLF